MLFDFDFAFEWDPVKDAQCLRERGFNFRFASQVFLMEGALRGPNRIKDGEVRESVFGKIPEFGYMFVAYTWRTRNGKKNCRIISARKIRASEYRKYQSLR